MSDWLNELNERAIADNSFNHLTTALFGIKC
jgi:hypothetical protein